MPSKVAPRKRAAIKRVTGEGPDPFMVEEIVRVPISKLKHHPKNPRKGNIPLIAKSLKLHGQIRPVLVQKSTMFIIVGNHTVKAAKLNKWTHIAVTFMDISDEQALEILLIENHTNEEGEIDDALLAAALADLPNVEAAGYTKEDLERLQAIEEEAVADLTGIQALVGKEDHGPEAGFEDEDEAPDNVVEAEEAAKGAFESSSEETPGVFSLKEAPDFDGVGWLGIPRIRPDMLVEELPSPLVTWAGSATKDWPDPDVWWFYNFGIDSTSGMKDVSRIVLAFFADDQYFENWWWYPERYMAKVLASRIKYAVGPDFSMPTEDPVVCSLWQLYKQRWITRYFQEIGVRVIPNIQCRYNDLDFLEKYVVPGIPVKAPFICSGAVAFDSTLPDSEFKIMATLFHKVVALLKPQNYLFYTNPAGAKFIRSLNLKTNVIIQPGRLEALSAQAKQRSKKKTL